MSGGKEEGGQLKTGNDLEGHIVVRRGYNEMENQNNGTMLHERTGCTIISHTEAVFEVHEMAEELRKRRPW